MEGPISPKRIDHYDGGNEQQQKNCKFSEAACLVWVAHEAVYTRQQSAIGCDLTDLEGSSWQGQYERAV
jgi:hypothetical protein